MNEVLMAIHDRRTVRDYKPDQIRDEDLAIILEAGRQAASAWNRQPWYFTVVQKKSLLDRIVNAAREKMMEAYPAQVKTMPWLVAPSFHYFYNAPTVVFISGQADNPDSKGDCAIAMINMVYAAHSLGIQSCMITTSLPAFATSEGPAFISELEIPEGCAPMFTLALGYTSKPLPPAAPRKEDYVKFVR